MTSETPNPPGKARPSRGMRRSKAKLATLAVAAVAAAGAFAAIEAGTSFAAGGQPAGAQVTGQGTGADPDEAEGNAANDARSKCASNAITGLAEAGHETHSQKPDGTWEATFTDICVDPGPNG